jgi:hypothetical protein
MEHFVEMRRLHAARHLYQAQHTGQPAKQPANHYTVTRYEDPAEPESDESIKRRQIKHIHDMILGEEKKEAVSPSDEYIAESFKELSRRIIQLDGLIRECLFGRSSDKKYKKCVEIFGQLGHYIHGINCLPQLRRIFMAGEIIYTIDHLNDETNVKMTMKLMKCLGCIKRYMTLLTLNVNIPRETIILIDQQYTDTLRNLTKHGNQPAYQPAYQPAQQANMINKHINQSLDSPISPKNILLQNDEQENGFSAYDA